jgi:hypothetical protein
LILGFVDGVSFGGGWVFWGVDGGDREGEGVDVRSGSFMLGDSGLWNEVAILLVVVVAS